MWIRPLAAIDAHCLVRTAADAMPLPLRLMVTRPLLGSGAAVAGRRRARSSGVALGFVQLEPFF